MGYSKCDLSLGRKAASLEENDREKIMTKKLGFGFMRLPLLKAKDTKSIDFVQLNKIGGFLFLQEGSPILILRICIMITKVSVH